MKRGATVKYTEGQTLLLERKMITPSHSLTLNRGRCVGCELCTAVCPQEAIEFKPGALVEGKLAQRPTVDIDPQKCNFCGECVVVCPVNALSMLVGEEAKLPVLEYQAFPDLTKQIRVQAAGLPVNLAHAAEECCPTDVISVQTRRNGTLAVEEIRVDESNCLYCGQCEALCPEAFAVIHPFDGLIRLEASLCPPGCQACADICPSHALALDDGKLVLDERFCLFCGACTRVCPVPEALTVRRHRVRHSSIKSGAWVTALQKLISVEMAADELAQKAQAKRRSLFNYLPEVPKSK